METIRNYLMMMFASLPNTAEARRARDELWQMMEDKYTELIEEGRTENEAVGTVISEFGNLDELAESLGISELLPVAVPQPAENRRNAGDTERAEREDREAGEKASDSRTDGGKARDREEEAADWRTRAAARRKRVGNLRRERILGFADRVKAWNEERKSSEEARQERRRREAEEARAEARARLYTVNAAEAQDYLNAAGLAAYVRGLAVFLFITSPVFAIFFEGVADSLGGSGWTDLLQFIGIVMLLLFVAAGVALLIYASTLLKPFAHLKPKKSCLDFAAARHVENIRETIRGSRMTQLTVGIVFCIMSVVPVIAVEALGIMHPVFENLGVVLLLVMVGIGVMLIMLSAGRGGACDKLLKLGDRDTLGGNSTRAQREVGFESPTVEAVMSVYWETVTAIYLIYSFLTFQWWNSWLIWPVAAVVRKFIARRYGRKAAED